MRWQELAACLEYDPDTFFPEPGHRDVGAAAKKICAGCEVRVECLTAATLEGERHGIWGGRVMGRAS